jgi:hypothetical protein
MGFRFRERMRGKLHFLSEPLVEHDITVEIAAHLRDLRKPIASVTGRITVEKLADNDTVQGTVGLGTLHERRIPYDLHFGDHLRLVGEKDMRWLAPVETYATLPFTIIEGPDAWKEIARGKLRFDVRHDWRLLVRSLRVSPF